MEGGDQMEGGQLQTPQDYSNSVRLYDHNPTMPSYNQNPKMLQTPQGEIYLSQSNGTTPHIPFSPEKMQNGESRAEMMNSLRNQIKN